MAQKRLKSTTKNPATPSRTRLIEAAQHLIRAQGYSATSVEQICLRAGVTKGSFFHHFQNKDDLALAAVVYWQQTTTALTAAARYHEAADPLDRLLGYLDLRAAALTGDLADTTCLLGALVQECYATHPAIRVACERALSAQGAALERDVAAAKRLYAPRARWSAESVSRFIEAALQGSFILAKAKQSPEVVRESIQHLRLTLRQLFQQEKASEPVAARGRDLLASAVDSEVDNTPLQSHFVD